MTWLLIAYLVTVAVSIGVPIVVLSKIVSNIMKNYYLVSANEESKIENTNDTDSEKNENNTEVKKTKLSFGQKILAIILLLLVTIVPVTNLIIPMCLIANYKKLEKLAVDRLQKKDRIIPKNAEDLDGLDTENEEILTQLSDKSELDIKNNKDKDLQEEVPEEAKEEVIETALEEKAEEKEQTVAEQIAELKDLKSELLSAKEEEAAQEQAPVTNPLETVQEQVSVTNPEEKGKVLVNSI